MGDREIILGQKLFAGVDIGGTKTAVALSLQPPVILERIVFPTCATKGPRRGIAQIVATVKQVLSSQGKKVSDLRAIGISCGGPLDPVRGVVQAPPNLPTWFDVPITSLLEEEFGIPCFLENDANAGALAEHWYGAGKGVRNMVFLTMGTGLGAGLIVEGSLYRGSSFLAGEIGHVRLTRTGPRGHNKVGSAEAWASGTGMAQAAKSVLRKSLLRGRGSTLAPNAHIPEIITARDVWEAALHGDSIAKGIVRMTGRRLGEVLALLIDLLNPERIVIGGLALRMGDALLGPAREVIRREALAATASVCEIVPAVLGEEIGDVAAICVALNADANEERSQVRQLITT